MRYATSSPLYRSMQAGVTTDSHYYFSVRKIRNLTLAYFKWVFDDTQPLRAFPGKLLRDIWLCWPWRLGRKGCASPWAIIDKSGDREFVTIAPGES